MSGCDFRCPFCHNGELVTGTCPPETDDQGLLAFLNRRKGLLDGVCVTGGEPLLRPDLPLLLGEIKELGFRVKVDTNGTHPDRLRRLVEEGLVDYVAMDVKNSPERYGETAGVYGLELASVRDSVSYLLSGAVDYEFRTTVVREFHNRTPSGPSAPGCPAPGGTSSSPSRTGTPYSSRASTPAPERSWRASPPWFALMWTR